MVGIANVVAEVSIEDQLLLMAHLAETVRQQWQPTATRRKWREFRAIAQFPMIGEDAQVWVSRTRQKGEQDRERQWLRERGL